MRVAPDCFTGYTLLVSRKLRIELAVERNINCLAQLPGDPRKTKEGMDAVCALFGSRISNCWDKGEYLDERPSGLIDSGGCSRLQ